LEHKIEEGIARGLSPKEARRAALCAIGGLEQRKEEMRDMRRLHWLTDFVDDLRYAIRGLRRTPGLTALVVITLAVGIGMTAMPVSMLDGLVFRPYTPKENEPALANAHHYLGAIYENEGRKAEAKQSYEAPLKLNPSLKDALDGLKRVS
jgi:tetratricopeptide (TPR) repeat protein